MDPLPGATAAPLRGRPRAPATLAVSALCVAAWSAAAVAGDTTSALDLVDAGALERGRVWGGEPWRLLTAPFLHAGAFHLAWNVAGALGTGPVVERALGTGRFLAVYAAAALGGSAASLLVQDAVSVGASGALFGLLGAVLALRHRQLGSWRAFTSDPPTRHLAVALALWQLVGVGLALGGIAMDHAAHVGGFLAGAAAATAAVAARPLRAALPVGAAILALAVAAAWPRPTLSRLGTWELERALGEALERDDWFRAKALVDRGLRGGVDTPFFRAAAEQVEGQRSSRE